MKFRIIIEKDENGMYVAECPSLPGCISEGKTKDEALVNIQDAIKGYMQSLKKHNEPIPPGFDEVMVEVNA
jgi:antitoxin HicB